MSDEEDWQSESEPDFSASEDEWVPEKVKSQDKKGKRQKAVSDSDEDDFEDDINDSESDDDSINSEDLSDEENSSKRKIPGKKRATTGRKRPKREPGKAKTFSFQNKNRKLFLKYKSPTVTNPAGTSSGVSSTSLAEILKKSEFKAKKLSLSQNNSKNSSDEGSDEAVKGSSASQSVKPPKNLNDSDSESSVDDYLVNPDQLDLNSDFFKNASDKKDESELKANEPPNFDCSGGVRASSESDNDAVDMESAPVEDENKKKTSTMIAKINKKSGNVIDLQENFKFNQNLESAKEQLAKIKDKKFTSNQEDSVNVEQLLLMGEEVGAPASTKEKLKKPVASSGKKRKKPTQDSDSDWEDVEIEGKRKKIKQISLLSFISKKKTDFK